MNILITEIQFKSLIENIIDEQYINIVNLTDAQINYYNKRWKESTDIKYTNNNFYKSLMNRVNKTKRLTKKQKWFSEC